MKGIKQFLIGFVTAALLGAGIAFAAVSTRIVYNDVNIGGARVANTLRYVQLAQAECNLAMNIANAVSAGGTTTANLEGSAEFGVGTGQGSSFYTTLQSICTNVNAVTAAQIGNMSHGT